LGRIMATPGSVRSLLTKTPLCASLGLGIALCGTGCYQHAGEEDRRQTQDALDSVEKQLGCGSVDQEYEFKAKVLLQMLSYVQWPQRAIGSKVPVDLVILGISPFGTSLDRGARWLGAGQRRVRIRYKDRLSDVGRCDALFLCKSEGSDLETIRGWARTNKVLTIAEAKPQIETGIMVNLCMDGKKWPSQISLAVNPSEAGICGIRFRSVLLKRAQILE